jgi:hypothetical protein
MTHISPPRPPLSFRVGVAGARKLPPARSERLREDIRAVLGALRNG